MKKEILRKLLLDVTKCCIQHTGWTCNTCFHAIPLAVSDDRIHELWRSTLQIRGDYSKEEIGYDDVTLMENIDELIKLLKGVLIKMDLKNKIQVRADELSNKQYKKDFYDLTSQQQDSIWRRAEVEVYEELQEAADILREEMELRGLTNGIPEERSTE